MSKPREFWIHKAFQMGLTVHNEPIIATHELEKSFHVIEYSEVERLKSEINDLIKERSVRELIQEQLFRQHCDEIFTLTAKVKRYEEAMVHIHKMGCAYKGNLTGCPACYICNEFPEFNEMNKRDRSEHGNN